MTSCEGSGPSPEDMAEGTNLPWVFEFSYGEDLDSGRVGLTMQTDAQLFQDFFVGCALDHFDDISATPMLFTPLTLMKMKVDTLLEPVSLKNAVIDEMVELKDLAATADDEDWLSDMLGAGAAKGDNHGKAKAAKGPSGHGPKPKAASSAEPLHAHYDGPGGDDDELLPEPAKALLEAYHHEEALDDLNCVGMEECASLASSDGTSSDSRASSSDQEGSQDGGAPPPPPPPHPAAAGRARGKGRGRGRGRGRPSAAAAAAGAEPDAHVGAAPAAKAKAKGKAKTFRDDAAQVICLPSANRQLTAYGPLLRSFGEVGFGE